MIRAPIKVSLLSIRSIILTSYHQGKPIPILRKCNYALFVTSHLGQLTRSIELHSNVCGIEGVIMQSANVLYDPCDQKQRHTVLCYSRILFTQCTVCVE